MLQPGPRHPAWQPTRPRYVALDVDGTLVGPDGTVSPDVVAACREAVDAGLHVGLATGRMALGVTDVLTATGLPGPHVLHNGAEVRLEGEVVWSTPVPGPALDALLELCRARELYVEVYVDDGFLVTVDDQRAADHWALLGHEPLGIARTPDDVHSAVPKVTAVAFEGDDVARITAALTEVGLRAGPAGSPATPHLRYVNGTHPDADKGRALRAAAEAVGCSIAEVMAVGDAGNDLPLLRTAGTAVAMGQAEEEVVAAAHLVTAPVTEDGAAIALRAAIDGLRDVPMPAAAGR